MEHTARFDHTSSPLKSSHFRSIPIQIQFFPKHSAVHVGSVLWACRQSADGTYTQRPESSDLPPGKAERTLGSSSSRSVSLVYSSTNCCINARRWRLMCVSCSCFDVARLSGLRGRWNLGRSINRRTLSNAIAMLTFHTRSPSPHNAISDLRACFQCTFEGEDAGNGPRGYPQSP